MSSRPSVSAALLAGVLLAPCFSAPLSAQSEDGVRVAAPNSLLSFVRWPEDGHQVGELTVGVLGENSLGSALDLLEGRTVFGRDIRVQRFASIADIGRPHILFIGAEASAGLAETLVVARERAILTVGETEDFTDDGGALSLRFPLGRLEITLNRCAFEDAGLEASSRLLRLADVMCPTEERR